MPRPDVVVLTGDFTNDDTAESYLLLRRLIRSAFPEPTPIMFVPGCAVAGSAWCPLHEPDAKPKHFWLRLGAGTTKTWRCWGLPSPLTS